MLIMTDIYNTSEDISPIVTVSCLESICSKQPHPYSVSILLAMESNWSRTSEAGAFLRANNNRISPPDALCLSLSFSVNISTKLSQLFPGLITFCPQNRREQHPSPDHQQGLHSYLIKQAWTQKTQGTSLFVAPIPHLSMSSWPQQGVCGPYLQTEGWRLCVASINLPVKWALASSICLTYFERAIAVIECSSN